MDLLADRNSLDPLIECQPVVSFGAQGSDGLGAATAGRPPVVKSRQKGSHILGRQGVIQALVPFELESHIWLSETLLLSLKKI